MLKIMDSDSNIQTCLILHIRCVCTRYLNVLKIFSDDDITKNDEMKTCSIVFFCKIQSLPNIFLSTCVCIKVYCGYSVTKVKIKRQKIKTEKNKDAHRVYCWLCARVLHWFWVRPIWILFFLSFFRVSF